MIPIKLQCGCGQRYAFDAETVDGLLATPVHCPACGAEGTEAANKMIARSVAQDLVMPPPTPPPIGARIRLAAAEAATPPATGAAPATTASAAEASRLGLVGREQAEVEARAKVSWGDPPENVLQYLMIQGFTHPEATALIDVLYRERAVAVRARGVKRILIGSGMIVGSAMGILYLLTLKLMPLKIMGVLFALAVWGLWHVINGAIMVAVPKMQSGDVAES